MRNTGLDVLRFVAVALVLGRHLTLPLDAHSALVVLNRGGWVGVDLFFVLSGYLVTSLLLNEYKKNGTLNVLRFWVRRAFKIYPTFWIFATAAIAIQTLRSGPPPLESVVVELIFIQNYFAGIWNHTWSLAVEEHFYIAVGLLLGGYLYFRPKTDFSSLPRIFLMIACVCLGLRILQYYRYPEYSDSNALFRTHLRIDSLFFGSLIAYLCAYRHLNQTLSRVPGWLMVMTGSALLSPAFLYDLHSTRWLTIYGFVLFYVGSGLILLASIRWERTSSRLLKIVSILGAASYTIYLWHMQVNAWALDFFPRHGGGTGFIFYMSTYVVGSFVIGWLLNHLLERPILRVRDAWFPSSR